MVGKVNAQGLRDGHVADAGPRLGRHPPLANVPARADAQTSGAEVDVLPAKRHEFAAAEPAVESRRPKGPLLLRSPGDQEPRLLGWDDPLAAATNGRELERGERRNGYLASATPSYTEAQRRSSEALGGASPRRAQMKRSHWERP